MAMGAFSRSLAKGRVDVDAWEMILVSIPDIADQLADSMKKSAQEVRALGAAGKLTTVELTERRLKRTGRPPTLWPPT